MSMRHDSAVEAMKRLLDELPAEFSRSDPAIEPSGRDSFFVIKNRNVRTVHRALWDLQVSLGMQED